MFDTRLTSECDKEFAVEANCDCRLFGVSFALVFVRLGGLASVFSRRSMPPTAYWTGNVKYEEARCGVLGGGEDFGVSVVDDMARVTVV